MFFSEQEFFDLKAILKVAIIVVTEPENFHAKLTGRLMCSKILSMLWLRDLLQSVSV